MQEIVKAKMASMREFLAGLQEKAEAYNRKAAELTTPVS
jgi:hypothetical protein